MFVDSDIEFPEDLIYKLLSVNKPLAAASYAKKRFAMDGLQAKLDGFKKLAGREPTSIEELSPLLVNSNLNLPAAGTHRVEGGFVNVKDAATGLMLISQEAFRLIADKYGDELTYFNDVSVAGTGIGGVPCPRGQRMIDLFGLMIDPVDRRLLSEDYAFCRRYSLAGGPDIPMLVSVTTVHHGRASYRCNPLMRWASEGIFDMNGISEAAPPASKVATPPEPPSATGNTEVESDGNTEVNTEVTNT